MAYSKMAHALRPILATILITPEHLEIITITPLFSEKKNDFHPWCYQNCCTNWDVGSEPFWTAISVRLHGEPERFDELLAPFSAESANSDTAIGTE